VITLPMRTLRQVLESGGPKLGSLAPDATLAEAARLMQQHGTDAVIVVDGGALVGVVSARNVADTIGRNAAPRDLRVTDVMVGVAGVSAGPDLPVPEALSRLQDAGLDHLPVKADGGVIALLSRADLLAALAAHYAEENRQIHQQWKLMHLQGVYSC
jgi:CBS domain-containing protein